MTAIPGYACLVRKSGVPTSITTEAGALAPSGQSVTFQISASARRVIDPMSAGSWHVKDGVTTIPYTNITSMDYLNGVFTFTGPLLSPSSMSFTGFYLPITTSSDVIIETKSWKLTDSADLLDKTVMSGTTAVQYRARLQGLKDVAISVETIASDKDLATLASQQFAGAPVVVEIFFGDAASVPRFRGFTQIESIEYGDEVAGLQSANISFKIAAILDSTANKVAGYTYRIHP